MNLTCNPLARTDAILMISIKKEECMRRRLLIVLSVLLVLYPLTVFAGGSNEGGGDGVREITLWTCWLDDGDKALFEAFNEAHDDIQVSWELIAFKDYATKIVAAANTNQLPDVLRMQPKAPAQYGKAGYLMPVEDIIADNGWEDVYPKSFLMITILRVRGR